MSIKNKNLSVVISVIVSLSLAAVLVYFGVGHLKEKHLFGKHLFKPLPPQSVFTSKGVSTRLLKVVLQYEKVAIDTDSAAIIAHVSMPFDHNGDLNYKWTLGEGVTLEEGAASGVIHNMRAGEEVEINVKVKGFSLMQNHHIAFEVNGVMNGRNIHGQSLIASDIENTFENTVQNVERIKSSQ